MALPKDIWHLFIIWCATQSFGLMWFFYCLDITFIYFNKIIHYQVLIIISGQSHKALGLIWLIFFQTNWFWGFLTSESRDIIVKQ